MRSIRVMVAIVASAAGLVLHAGEGFAYSDAVISACTNDYMTYCGAYDEDSARGRQCMRAASSKLSQGCVNALIASGEASKTEVASRSAKHR